MFALEAAKNELAVVERETLTSGSAGVYEARFTFSPDWDALDKTAVFRSGDVTRSVLLDASGLCEIPWEVLTASGRHLFTGVRGTRGGHTVRPTIWADLGLILEGASPGEGARPPDPELWEQQLARKGDALGYAPDGELGLWSGDELLSSVPIVRGGGEGGPAYQFGHGFKVMGRIVSVDTVDGFEGDNTLPMTAAGVQTAVGNIEALLGTI